MDVVFNQIPNALQHEFFGVKTHRVTTTGHPLGQLVQERKGSIIGGKKVEPPSAIRVGFHMVQKAVMAVLDQEPAQSVTASVCGPVLGLPSLGPSPPISVALLPLWRRETDGAEVAQQSVGKGWRRSVIVQVFSRVAPKHCSKCMDRRLWGGWATLAGSVWRRGTVEPSRGLWRVSWAAAGRQARGPPPHLGAQLRANPCISPKLHESYARRAIHCEPEMPLIHHVVTGAGHPAVVFVHGFGCAHSDWTAQVAHLSPRHQTVAVDLRGHDASPGTVAECSIERFGADVAEVIQALALPPAVLVGHSMGCRVVIEAALQAPAHTAGVVLVDGSQFAPAMETVLRQTFATPNGFEGLIRRWFQEMFTAKSNAAVIASVVERAERLPRSIGEKLLLDMLRYDVARLTTSLADLRVPVMALQTTYSNEQRERRPMSKGQTTPYLDMLGSRIPSVRIEVIENTGHFPQLDEITQTNMLLDQFLATLSAR